MSVLPGEIGESLEHRRQQRGAMAIDGCADATTDEVRRVLEQPDVVVHLRQHVGRHVVHRIAGGQHENRQTQRTGAHRVNHRTRTAMVLRSDQIPVDEHRLKQRMHCDLRLRLVDGHGVDVAIAPRRSAPTLPGRWHLRRRYRCARPVRGADRGCPVRPCRGRWKLSSLDCPPRCGLRCELAWERPGTALTGVPGRHRCGIRRGRRRCQRTHPTLRIRSWGIG